MQIHCFRLVFLLLLTVQASAQSIDSTLAKFERYQRQTPLEKAYLHTDKEVYVQNETLWFSAYLIDASTFRPTALSRLLYVDLISPENKLVSSLPIKIEEGTGAGEFFLADSLAEGTYTIMAYTNYMRNFDPDYFFSKPIKLLHYKRDTLAVVQREPSTDIDFQLFPEGGQLINGMVNMIAFRITNEKGFGVDMTGNIINGTGEIIGQLATEHLGMGVFQFTPEDGKKYFAEYEVNGEFKSIPLPESKNSGYQLSVRQDTYKTYVTVKATPDLSLNDCFVLAHIRGKVVSVFRAKPGDSYIHNFLNHNQVPSGIIHFTVFNSGQPILQRLAYIDNPIDLPVLTTILENEQLKRREMANFEISLSSGDTLFPSGSVSVSVLKASDQANKVDIENFLLLSSDLKGTIENPEYYSDHSNPNRIKSLNLLMMTHGWRRFDWKNVLVNSLPPITHYPEKGFTIEGKAVKYYNREKGDQVSLILSFLGNLDFKMVAETGEDGAFWFDGLQIVDTVTLLVRTVVKEPTKSQKRKASKRKEGDEIRDKGTFIIINDVKPPAPYTKYLDLNDTKERYWQQLQDHLKIEQVNLEFDERTIVLDEISVTAKRAHESDPFYRDNVTMPYAQPDSRTVIDSIRGVENYYNIFDIVIRAFPLVQTRTGRDGLKMLTYKGDSLAVYLDGRKLVTNGQLYGIDPRTVEFIDLMRGFTPLTTDVLRSSVGSDGFLTVQKSLFIFSRKTPRPVDPDGIQFREMYGYYQSAEFYIPKYDIMSAKEKVKPDFRTTQYWNPGVKITNGKASISYYASDNKGDFVMYFEGITNEGKIVKNQFKFSVN